MPDGTREAPSRSVMEKQLSTSSLDRTGPTARRWWFTLATLLPERSPPRETLS
jgi:hypothetical protein